MGFNTPSEARFFKFRWFLLYFEKGITLFLNYCEKEIRLRRKNFERCSKHCIFLLSLRETIWHTDRILAIFQMSNSFVNCFVYAKMHKYVLKKKRNASNSSAGTVATTNGSRNENRRGSQDVFGSSVNPNYATSIFMDTNWWLRLYRTFYNIDNNFWSIQLKIVVAHQMSFLD